MPDQPKPKPKTNLPAAGNFTLPPANAPQEVSQPLTDEARLSMLEKANQHERELAPLKFALAKAVAAATGAQSLAVETAPPAAAPDAPSGSASGSASASGSVLDPIPPPLASHPPISSPEPAQPHQKAASNTDSPSRGQPKPILDPHKQITGGWGEESQFEPQYYALDGTELAALIRTIWKELAYELDRDLRFGIASCYPQVMARVTIEVNGATPTAQTNDVAFTIASRVLYLSGVKVDDQVTPADALRVEAGLSRPYKHVVKTPTGSFIVDREAPGDQGVEAPDQPQPQPQPDTEGDPSLPPAA